MNAPRLWWGAAALLVLLMFASRDDASAAADPRLRTGDRGIVVLTAEWCGYCRQQEAAMTAAGVAYEAVDVDTDTGRDAYDALDGRGVPITVVGQDVIHGYDPAALQAALEPLGYQLR